MSPEEMVRALAGLTKLRDLCIEFSTLESESYEFHDELKLRTPQSPPLVVIFPALTKFQMGGDNEYLEHFMALVNAPRLENLSVEYPKLDVDGLYGMDDSEINLDAGNLSQFISCTATFEHAQFRRVELILDRYRTYVNFDLPHGECQQARLSLAVSQMESREGPSIDTASDLSHVLGQLAIMFSDVQHLSIKGMSPEDKGNRNSVKLGLVLVPFFRSFPAVDVLHVSQTLAGDVVSALKNMPEMVAEVLPALQVLWLDGRRKNRLILPTERFLSLRKQAGRSVVVVTSRKMFVKTLNPHQMELSESPPVSLDGT